MARLGSTVHTRLTPALHSRLTPRRSPRRLHVRPFLSSPAASPRDALLHPLTQALGSAEVSQRGKARAGPTLAHVAATLSSPPFTSHFVCLSPLSSARSPFSSLAALLCVACRTMFHLRPQTLTRALCLGPGPQSHACTPSGRLARTNAHRLRLTQMCPHLHYWIIKSPRLVCAARDNDSCGKGIVLVLPDSVRTAIGGVSHLFCLGMVRPAGPSDPISGRDVKWDFE